MVSRSRPAFPPCPEVAAGNFDIPSRLAMSSRSRPGSPAPEEVGRRARDLVLTAWRLAFMSRVLDARPPGGKNSVVQKHTDSLSSESAGSAVGGSSRRVIPSQMDTVFEYDYVQAEDMRVSTRKPRDQWNASRDIAWDAPEPDGALSPTSSWTSTAAPLGQAEGRVELNRRTRPGGCPCWSTVSRERSSPAASS
jgi:hypothetical protein